MSSSCHLVATGVAGTGENTLCAGENSEVLHQLRDANLDIKESRRKEEEDLLLLSSQTFLHKEL